MNKIYETNLFKKILLNLSKDEKIRIEKIKTQLAHCLNFGKPLGFRWFREKKLKEKRIYFLINFKTRKVLFVAISTKKKQQEMINFILKNKERFLRIIN
ncbi:hypothetical protein KY321_05765 [Candidatus Woesearchaeota archaeon]|nr:hypothetical protein [Candidatus Woesearchaeota archaeon]